MPDSKRFLHPEAIKRISRMELRARHVVEGFLSGMHRSPYFGQSIEFAQHREYVQGDDLRHIDWKVWARQDRLYVKQYEEDTNLRCMILLDGSGSMQYGGGVNPVTREERMNKYEYACTAAACLSYLALRQQDSVGCVLFDEKVRVTVPGRSKHNHILSIVDAFDRNKPSDKTDLYPILRAVTEQTARRGLMILLSDLFGDPAQTLRGLRLLRQRGHDVMVLHVLDDDELDFPFNGPTKFEGLESDDSLTCNPRALREGYLKALEEFLHEVRRGCAKSMIDYRQVRTSDPLDAILASYLSARLGMHGRN
ncbi:MAG TPA: DUF58 domain-containing protein [Pirellulaceae bacterium]|jgi:uncharacterized protein (DUF58 family)|nr:DUF58 domain-containing protein [Pirellulaceae bacterium]